MKNLQPHPLASEFPEITGEEREQFAADIAAHGALQPIWIYEGKILDGVHRYREAIKSGKPFQIKEFKGRDPLEFVLSMNIHRRHLNTSQRAVVYARLMSSANRWVDDHSHPKLSEQTAGQPGPRFVKTSVIQAARQTQTSERTMTRAKAVVDAGKPLAQAVESGELSLAAAEVIAPRVAAAKTETVKAAIVQRHVATVKAKERPRVPVKKETPKSFSFTSEVKWLIEYLRAWRAVLVQDASVALRQGKFSPEAAAYFARELRKTFEPIAEEFEKWATSQNGKTRK